MVTIDALHNMRQDRDKTVHSFGARLQGQANIFKFIVKCTGCDLDVNYTEAIMRDVLSRGLTGLEIQIDLLGDIKVRKTAKIRKRYNQVPHLTQDTTWESGKK